MIELLAEPDLAWVEIVVDVIERNVGRPWRDALEQLEDLQRGLQLRPPPTHTWQRHGWSPARGQPTVGRRFSAVVSAVQRLTGSKANNRGLARRARSLVLGHPALRPADRDERIARAADTLGMSAGAIEAALWSDVPRERPVELRAGRLSEIEVAAHANVGLLQRAALRAQTLRLEVRGQDAGVFVRAAAARGLLVTATGSDDARPADDATIVEIAGPLSIVRRTAVYGRALSELLPLLGGFADWSLAIGVELPLASYTVHASSPVLLPAPPARMLALPFSIAHLESALRRLVPSLAVTPAPSMLCAGRRRLWPDLAVRRPDGATLFVEVLGFWTRTFLAERQAAYHTLGAEVLLCIDTARDGDGDGDRDGDGDGDGDHGDDREAGASEERILRYRRRVSADDLAQRLTSWACRGVASRAG